MDVLIEQYNQHNQQQQRYTYYIIALCVASIGFSVHQTFNIPLAWSQLPLGVAVVMWATSIFSGLHFLERRMLALSTNMKLTEVQSGIEPTIGLNLQKVVAASEGLKSAMNTHINKGGTHWRVQKISFYAGMLFFLGWHVYEMYLVSLN